MIKDFYADVFVFVYHSQAFSGTKSKEVFHFSFEWPFLFIYNMEDFINYKIKMYINDGQT